MTSPEETPPQPAMPLDYSRPMPRATGHARDLVIGIVMSIALALGVGFLTFGLMVSTPNISRNVEMAATFTAIGACLLALVAGLIGTVLWLRFIRR